MHLNTYMYDAQVIMYLVARVALTLVGQNLMWLEPDFSATICNIVPVIFLILKNL